MFCQRADAAQLPRSAGARRRWPPASGLARPRAQLVSLRADPRQAVQEDVWRHVQRLLEIS